jgi:hypothetical protein
VKDKFQKSLDKPISVVYTVIAWSKTAGSPNGANCFPLPAEVSAQSFCFCVSSCVFVQEGTLFLVEVKQDAECKGSGRKEGSGCFSGRKN